MAKKKGLLAVLFGTSSKGKKSSSKRTSATKRSSRTAKKTSVSGKKFCKRKSDIRKIYETTDGYFTQNPNITKRRRVAVLKQRKDDGALAVTKIYSQDEKKVGEQYIEKLVLSPKKHKSLNKNSIVGSKAIVGTKDKEGNYKTIQSRDFEETGDKLTKKEHRIIMDNLGGGNEKHKQTNKNLLENWENHFKK